MKYRGYIELRTEPWTVILAVAVAALIGLMLLRMGDMMRPTNPQAMMTQMMAGIDKTLEHLNTAMAHTTEALQATDLAALRKHVGLAQGALAGRGGAITQMQMMGQMMQGPMMTMAGQGMMGMSMEHHADMMAALEAARSSIKSALEHLREAAKADKLETAHEHVRLAAERLQAAKGMSSSSDPKAGALMYLKEQMAQMMGQGMMPSALQSKIDCAVPWLEKAITLHELHMKDPTTTTEQSQMELMDQIKKAYECLTGKSMPGMSP
ncbi:hypothetical protein HRbin07_00161 [bacterium HR07]|uniref:Uncharacterized protein n=1 Tax=Acetithermum autotrophicum TaxID=1446466 RepID=H5SUZ7_ACEAU|nr:hypothetical protein HGMM_OP4C062 [Candidatus Acetothermum autotrophicum]GBC75969.1 hypothetical protein HRbin07_00161 [bacterium HR07]